LVLKLLSKKEPGAQIARRAGISEQTLYRWRDEFIRGGTAELAGRGSAAVPAKEITKLQDQLAERGPNRILKTLGPVQLSEELRTMVREALDVRVYGISYRQ
jgi:transposase-like protein